MIKPRIIIADEEYSYIASFVAKFATDYYGKIELEVITEREYFNQFFSTPQNIDVLIISEALYSPEIKKHNIKSIFLLVEEESDGETGELDITRIFKYSSLKEIFNQIVGKSRDVFSARVNEEKKSKIVLFTSTVGGVGKTTMAMGMAANLAATYKRVLYINAEQLQTFQFRMKDNTPILDNDTYNYLVSQNTGFYRAIKQLIRNDIFDYVPAFKAAISSLGIDSSIYSAIALEAKNSGDYDYIIIDGDSALDDTKLSLLDSSDNVFVITTQDKLAMDSTDYFVKNINVINSDKYFFICNKHEENKENAIVGSESKYSFLISEYISQIDLESGRTLEALSQNYEMKKLSFLVM